MTSSSRFALRMQRDDILNFLADAFGDGWQHLAFDITDLQPGLLVARMEPTRLHLRPGGTISGPTLFTLADVGAYALINAHTGPRPLSVTTNLNINFMRKPALASLNAHCQLLKLGKRLAVVDCRIIQDDHPEDPVAQATATYALQQDIV